MLLCLFKVIKEYLNGNKKWYYYVIPLVFVAITSAYTLPGISTEVILQNKKKKKKKKKKDLKS